MAATADITGLTRETDCKTSNSLKQFLKQINATILSWLFFRLASMRILCKNQVS